jgi:hypothetical protein
MLNYEHNVVEIQRYFIGFIFTSLSYAMGRPAILKQLTRNAGVKNFQDYGIIINLVECLGFLFGVLWGVYSILTFKSLFITVITIIIV